jgi:hypothetical protein
MIRLAFKLVSFFWILSPVAYIVGRCLGVYNFKFDILVFAGLMVMCGIACFLNVEEK